MGGTQGLDETKRPESFHGKAPGDFCDLVGELGIIKESIGNFKTLLGDNPVEFIQEAIESEFSYVFAILDKSIGTIVRVFPEDHEIQKYRVD